MNRWHCTSEVAECTAEALCDRCYGSELADKRPQARVAGQCWAESICRGDLRARETWPTEDAKTLAIARRKMASLARDPRMVEPLPLACSQGAAAWWLARPAMYRV